MFNFIKKAGTTTTSDKDDKDRRKKDKKERKEKQKRDRTSMTTEEVLRLDEVRRSLKLRGRRKEKEKLPSGITADYTASFLASLDRSQSPSYSQQSIWNKNDGLTQSDSSEASLTSLNNHNKPNLPPVPPRPPKRGILKGPRVSITKEVAESPEVNGENGDFNNLIRNTLRNEVITYQNVPNTSNGEHSEDKIPNSLGSNLLVITSTSPSADSLTDTTTNSSFATPPFSLSPVGESQGFHRWSRCGNFDESLPLPLIVPLELPRPRVLTIQRQRAPRNDFGFSLRRAMIVERNVSGVQGPNVQMKAVIFAEPGTIVQHCNETGLLPGDRLLEVNGICVDDKSREEIIDLIKGSRDQVTVKVRFLF